MIDRIERRAREHIASLQSAISDLWQAMCKEDGIDPNSMFIVFSDDNIFKPFYDKAVQQLWEAKSAYHPGGGYVGLRIENGKATL